MASFADGRWHRADQLIDLRQQMPLGGLDVIVGVDVVEAIDQQVEVGDDRYSHPEPGKELSIRGYCLVCDSSEHKRQFRHSHEGLSVRAMCGMRR